MGFMQRLHHLILVIFYSKMILVLLLNFLEFDPGLSYPFQNSLPSLPSLPGITYTGPLFTKRPLPTAASTSHDRPKTSFNLNTNPPPPPTPQPQPNSITTLLSSALFGSKTTPVVTSPSTPPPVVIDESASGPPGSLGLLYAFSEASKRLPIAELPMHMDYMGQSLNNWAGNTVKGIGSQASSFGDTVVEYLQSAAGEAIKRSGDMLTSGLNSLERTVKEYLADWIGCHSNKKKF